MRTRVHVDVNPYLDKKRRVSLAESFDLTQDEVKIMANQVDYLFRRYERELFNTEGGASGRRWKKLSDEYAKFKKRAASGRRATNRGRKLLGAPRLGSISNKIMQFSGGLKKSLTQTKQTNDDHVAYGVAQPRPSITVGTRNRLAAYHGPTTLGNPKLPLRDVLDQSNASESSYLQALADYFVKNKMPRIDKLLRRWKATRVA